jgi:hypothetical protein
VPAMWKVAGAYGHLLLWSAVGAKDLMRGAPGLRIWVRLTVGSCFEETGNSQRGVARSPENERRDGGSKKPEGPGGKPRRSNGDEADPGSLYRIRRGTSEREPKFSRKHGSGTLQILIPPVGGPHLWRGEQHGKTPTTLSPKPLSNSPRNL